MNFRYRL